LKEARATPKEERDAGYDLLKEAGEAAQQEAGQEQQQDTGGEVEAMNPPKQGLMSRI
jgi:hypothetical protein